MNWMIYGANGYTGNLMARKAKLLGLGPTLAGRNAAAVQSLAAELGLPYRIISLDDTQHLTDALTGMKLVMHCAGPFSATSAPMIEACLATGTDYLDVTGEISVFEHAWKQSDRARKSDVVLCPGAGFDVVPTDCLAARLVQALPAATHLQLAFEAGGGLSPGTARTGVEGLGSGGCVRRDGKLQAVPLAWKTREIPFQHAKRHAVTIPWGDVFTAWVSTGIPNIEVYLSSSEASVKKLRRMRWLKPVLSAGWVQAYLKKQVDKRVSGPDAETRAASVTQLWGEASSADGRRVSATMETPNGYDLTVIAGLGLVQFLLENSVEGGYYTPSLLAGAGFAESLPGVRINLQPVSTPD